MSNQNDNAENNHQTEATLPDLPLSEVQTEETKAGGEFQFGEFIAHDMDLASTSTPVRRS